MWLTCLETTSVRNLRKRVFTAVLTFWAWLSQVLDPHRSCRRTLCRVQFIRVARG